MSKKRPVSKLIKIEPDFSEILVCENKALKPYLEIFILEPENIAQSGLGTFFGIFEITDHSQESSYIVNYLISVVKKEYFSNPKRGAIESFEASLHKANLALAKLAEHESIGSIGHLNSICGVIEKNNLHLTQTGTASAFLLRSDMLTPVAEPEEENISPNPLKTFQDVLSGRMEKNDKLILATNTIFDIFSLSEIKKSALKFSSEEFIRFLKTALSNELEKAAVLIVNLQEKEYLPATIGDKKEEAPQNVFSQKAFEKEARLPVPAARKETIKKEKIIAELKEEIQKNNGEFIDQKTGHIYIKEDYFSPPKENSSSSFFSRYEKLKTSWKESSAQVFQKTKETVSAKVNSAPKMSLPEKKISLPTVNWKEKFVQAKIILFTWSKKIHIFGQKVLLFLKDFLIFKAVPFLKSSWGFFQNKYAARKKINVHVFSRNYVPRSLSPNQAVSAWKNRIKPSSLKSLTPNFSRLGTIFRQLDTKKRISLIGILLAIIIIPYFLARFSQKEENKEEPIVTQSSAPVFPLEQDKNIEKIPALSSVYSGNDIVKVVNVNEEIFVVTGSQIIGTKDNNAVAVQNSSALETAWEMDDLNLLFLLDNENKVTSFSPTSSKFQPNQISIPANAAIISAKSYLTYAYLLDKNNNQIYRYPRSEGGFGEKSNWLKTPLNLSDAKDMAINEDIFIINNNEIQKLSRGKKEEFKVESTATPIIPDKIYTKPESANIFVLDKNNSRIIKLDQNGSILAQYYHQEIESSQDLVVDEEKKEVYIFSNSEVKKFPWE